MGLLANLLHTPQHQQQTVERQRADVYRSLMRWEAKLGGELFGPVPKGTRREFFCLDPKTWVWHEEWTDERGRRQTLTTRYDIRANGVLKSQGTDEYYELSQAEATNLYNAISMYGERVLPELDRWRNIEA